MFKFLKEKISESISRISKKIEEESPEEEVERVVEEEKPAEEVKEKAKEVGGKEEKPVEEKKEVIEEKREEEKPEEGEEKAGLFGKFRKFFKKEYVEEEKQEVEEKTPEEKAKEKKEDGEKFLADIKKEISETEEVRKKEEVEVKKKEEVEKRIKEKIEAGNVPSLRDLIARKEALKPKEEPKPRVEEKKEVKVEKPEEKKELKQEDIIKSIAAGKNIEEVTEEEVEEEKKGFFGKLKERIITKNISEKQFDELFWELEVALLENNVAVEVIEKIKNDLKISLLEKPVLRNKVNTTIIESLKKSIKSLFDVEQVDIFQRMEKKKPLIMCFVGINGSGKTTTIAKVAALLQKYKFNLVIAASDTFRAAAMDQLQEHANNLGIKMIKHDYGADPAAVAFDAIKYAESKGLGAVLIDTAGRLHSNINLMDEMKKIVRVAKPDLKIFVGESITGNDCVEQAKQFDDAIGIDGIILSKADVDEKGGAAISVGYVTKKPIMYLGTGQKYEDLEEFDSEKIMQSLGL